MTWEVIPLGEQAIMLRTDASVDMDHLHQSTLLIQEIIPDEITDIVPSYHSIALFFDGAKEKVIKQKLQKSKKKRASKKGTSAVVDLPICYELGSDLDKVATHAGLEPQQIIDIHLKGMYRSLFIGFTPGFIYADGLDKKLACPRKSNPQEHLRAGSIGIGGSQTGIYSLDSPGGWNIIGRTPVVLFNKTKNPPMTMDVGTRFRFYAISKKEFESWEN